MRGAWARTAADLVVPVAPMDARAPWIGMRDKLLATVDEYIGNPKTTTPARLQLLAAAVMPLAQCMVGLGTLPGVAIGHASELLEAMFLPAALRDSPELLELCLDQ